MKRLLAAAVVAAMTGILGHGAVAQNAPPEANPRPSTPAVVTGDANNPGAPAVGANSFTRSQAISRIRKAGYTRVSNLVKDKDGIWRGKAVKGNTTVPVALDYQGNVVPK
jgi:hypothetical protein